MAYTDDAVKAKLSALNETQEGIVTVAQWIMFHRRHADKTANLWMQRLKDSTSSKRLNLIYLANEVVQQSKIRNKKEFVDAFSNIIAESTQVAYRSASPDVQQKIMRVVEVWRQRQIFDPSVLDAIEKGIRDVDQSRGGGKKATLGGSLFASSANGALPPLLVTAGKHAAAIEKAELTGKNVILTAQNEYARMTDPEATVPTPPVYAARLSGLLKNLANAESA
ncbi:hypothetical protein LTS18_002017, partial [Coniosporium uncinatum]